MSALCSAALGQTTGCPSEKKSVSYPDLTINLTNYSVTHMGKTGRHAPQGAGAAFISWLHLPIRYLQENSF